ncbi:hypothetical protein PYCCODRAFT_1429190 [Trametes coccinea BRFM310]|uniref:HIG1 domain-containing protein n=1 Tax=Trametes coccinea (strain BRFM310) TaxID=1353009 RepID=A0A1Y2I8N6_TRAC3|nr:hypothetical protein PYCCODRAFT_1429190 [Trametes coccinea BRFM310]
MQGLTICAVVGGSWWYGQMKHQKEAAAAAENERVLERAAFEARLRAAEEADRIEKLEEEIHARGEVKNGGVSSSGWLGGWFGFFGASSSVEGEAEQFQAASWKRQPDYSVKSTRRVLAASAGGRGLGVRPSEG